MAVLGHLEAGGWHRRCHQAIGGGQPRPSIPDRRCSAHGHRSRGDRWDPVHHLWAISDSSGAILEPPSIPFPGKNIQPLLYFVRGKSGSMFWYGIPPSLSFGHLPGKIF